MKSMFPEKVKGYTLEKLSGRPLAGFAKICNKTAREGIVLLKNKNDVLPIAKGSRISVFGRIQERYYAMGTGSGGGVHPLYTTDILSSLRERKDVTVNEELAEIYSCWIAEHPFDNSNGGWIKPISQEEMPLSEEIVAKAAKASDFALIIIGRTLGEDMDSRAEAGAYYLSKAEEDMIKKVRAAFKKVCVFLNVSAIIDTSWAEKYDVDALVYGWQGGQEGGSAAVSVLMGDYTPCGKLADTIAYRLCDYPSDKNFGNTDKNAYQEDIYVGYRYFETFAKDAVQYPFGFGLSYTSFEILHTGTSHTDGAIEFSFAVKNTGSFSGKEVVQVYLSAPQGKLGKPAKALVGYAKTNNIAPNKTAYVKVAVPISYLASYDDSGKSGYRYCFVLEEGEYTFLAGNSSADVCKIYSFEVAQNTVTEKLTSAAAPTSSFERMIPKETENGFEVSYEDVPLRQYDIEKRIADELPRDIPYTGDKGFKLSDVANGKCTLDEFLAQLTDLDLMCLCRGEGMQSPKVPVDTASIFGGVTRSLLGFGIPLATTNDGPCGIRDLVSGTNTTSMPNGTCIACTFNDALVEDLMTYEAMELYTHSLDTLLGPGINIHRHPMNGRNFEYFSEDPILAGKMAAAMSRGAKRCGKSVTLKHMAANNQETNRRGVDSVLSERALREIYLRPFEIAVKEGGADSIMTSYNPINGIWAAGNYDMNTVILRDQWSYDGIVMTDWWAECNGKEGEFQSKAFLAQMVISQNDVYMVCTDPKTNPDNMEEFLSSGKLHRSQLHRCAKNICKFILHTRSFEYYLEHGYNDPTVILDNIDSLKVYSATACDVNDSIRIPLSIKKGGIYVLRITYSANFPRLEQHFCWFNFNGKNGSGCSLLNTDGISTEKTLIVTLPNECVYLHMDIPDRCIHLEKIEILGNP